MIDIGELSMRMELKKDKVYKKIVKAKEDVEEFIEIAKKHMVKVANILDTNEALSDNGFPLEGWGDYTFWDKPNSKGRLRLLTETIKGEPVVCLTIGETKDVRLDFLRTNNEEEFIFVWQDEVNEEGEHELVAVDREIRSLFRMVADSKDDKKRNPHARMNDLEHVGWKMKAIYLHLKTFDDSLQPFIKAYESFVKGIVEL